mmetsp:Transcript_34377/g.79483  ORF Transcript_34377/g.79483 Transcript_34377/m.79483 type:complete len:120 (-) Transcript_34377:77-436(-)
MNAAVSDAIEDVPKFLRDRQIPSPSCILLCVFESTSSDASFAPQMIFDELGDFMVGTKPPVVWKMRSVKNNFKWNIIFLPLQKKRSALCPKSLKVFGHYLYNMFSWVLELIHYILLQFQ